MNTIYTSNQKFNPTALIIVGIVLLVATLVILYFTVFRFLKYKKMAAEIDKRYSICNSLLNNTCWQNIKRFEIISRTNLLYVDIYTSFTRRFKEIRDRNEIDSNNAVNEMKDNLSDKNLKLFKECYSHAVEVVEEYEKVIKTFAGEIANVLKPEEDCNQICQACKIQLRSLKAEYYSKENQLTMINESFKALFEYLNNLFTSTEEFLNSAQYDDANRVLDEIRGILVELEEDLKILPDLCTLIDKIIPEKIHTVELAYSDMRENHYPLSNLFVEQTLELMNNSLTKFSKDLLNFEINTIPDDLKKMEEKLELFLKQFEEEKTAKTIFDEKNDNVYNQEAVVENRFIKLKNTIPDVSTIYVINEIHLSKIKEIQEYINNLGTLKRSLDTYINSSAKQPYSLIVVRMNELEELVKSISSELDEFDSYIDSLRTDSENAYNLVFSTYDKVKKAEETIRIMNLEAVNKKYDEKIEIIYDLLNKIYTLLFTQPINVDELNSTVRQLSLEANPLLDDGLIAQDYEMMCLAESAIMYGNKYRDKLADVDQLFTQAELFFASGDFEKANEIAKSGLNKIKQANGK